jgi:hypothetical protein
MRMNILVEKYFDDALCQMIPIVFSIFYLLPVVYVTEQQVFFSSRAEITRIQSRKRRHKFKCHLCKFSVDESLQALRNHLNDVHKND